MELACSAGLILSALACGILNSRHALLCEIDEHRSLDGLVCGDAKANACFSKRRIAARLALRGGLHPLYLYTRMRHEADKKGATGDDERVRLAQQVIAAGRRAAV